MKVADTVNMWRNAVKTLSEPNKQALHPRAEIIMREINQEWEKRYRLPIDPDEIFMWPSTQANTGSGYLYTENWIKEGGQQCMGYRVGDTDGESQGIRERILAEIFSGWIPPVFPRVYLDEWGVPASAGRLRKMAETITALTRIAKRPRGMKMQSAIRDREKDLNFLYLEFYVGYFYFSWPESSI